MREELVTPTVARRLAQEGLSWEPGIGDWCTVLGAAHIGEGNAGLWLVAGIQPATGLLALVDAAGQWPIAQVPARDCLWLPTAGKLKMWLRARGYVVTTGAVAARVLGATSQATRDVCRATRPGDPAPVDGEGLSEADAVADVILRLLGGAPADAPRVSW
ncbi:MAG: hypothetical protein IVW57_12430 [Ktedonobacterales bacterium]|nr:hypothetical protein [Ktedonobacterales bacterium]